VRAPPAPLPTPSTPRGTPLCPRQGFSDSEGPSDQFLPMQRGHGRLRRRVVCHLDKAKAPWAPRSPVGHEVDAIDHTVGREQCTHVLLGDGEREMPKKNVHWRSLLGHCHPWQPQDCEEKTALEAIHISTEVLGYCEKPLL
jgi:hypothetical protein